MSLALCAARACDAYRAARNEALIASEIGHGTDDHLAARRHADRCARAVADALSSLCESAAVPDTWRARATLAAHGIVEPCGWAEQLRAMAAAEAA